MRRVITFVLLCCSITAMAQKNPMAGYIVTNENDTVTGTIDYLSGNKMAWSCQFCRDGETTFRTYTPQDIKGFRMTDNGAYYVTRTFPLHGGQQTFFAEYLLKGGISVYRHEEGDLEYFYLEDEEGRVAELQGREAYDLSRQETSSERHKALRSAMLLLGKSEEATKSLWESRINSQNLVDIIRRYNEQYCTSSGDCIEFRFKAKQTARSVAHICIEGGIAINRLYVRGGEKSVLAPRFSVGVDWQFPRVNPSFSLQAALSCAFGATDIETALRYAYTQEGQNMYFAEQWNVKYTQLALRLGGAWRFIPKGKISPYVKAGLSMEEVFFNMNQTSQYPDNAEQSKALPQLGWYVGGGVAFAVGSHHLYVDASYGHSIWYDNTEFKYLPQTITATVGWMF